MSEKLSAYLRYNDVGRFSRKAADMMLATLIEKEFEMEGYVDIKDGHLLKATILSEDKEEIVDAISTLMYNYDITIEDITSELAAKQLLGAPKQASRFMLLPVEMGE